jgi:glycosyltransferase involved in cell wall biosynthesis
MIAYYFPPLGGAGVQRSAKFAKYLARKGWRVEIVTVEPPSFELRDESGLHDIADPLIQVRRVNYRERFRGWDRLPGGWRLRAWCQDWLLFPDRMAGWLKPALDMAGRICTDRNDITIYTTSAPYTAHLIGRHLKQRFHLPWIADFRDEWSQNPYLSSPARCRLPEHIEAEGLVLNGADAVLTVTAEICAGLRQLAPQSKAIFKVIPNGFDPEDFSGLIPAKNRCFTLTHVGTVNQARLKLLQPLVRLLARLSAAGRFHGDTVKLRMVGPGNYPGSFSPGNDLLEIEVVPYVAHREALQSMVDSDLLILAESNPAAFTGKIFEYLALKKPILGLVHPQSPAANLICQAGAGWVIGPDFERNSEVVAQVLLDCYQAKQNQTAVCSPSDEVIGLYNRENQARQLADLIIQIQSRN